MPTSSAAAPPSTKAARIPRLGGPMTPEQLLAEAEDIIRTMPPRPTIRHPTPQNHAWLGRTVALITRWRGDVFAKTANDCVSDVVSLDAHRGGIALNRLLVMLQQARHDLINAVSPMSIVINQGALFDYFDAVRQKIELAKTDVFFVDPYLAAD